MAKKSLFDSIIEDNKKSYEPNHSSAAIRGASEELLISSAVCPDGKEEGDKQGKDSIISEFKKKFTPGFIVEKVTEAVNKNNELIDPNNSYGLKLNDDVTKNEIKKVLMEMKILVDEDKEWDAPDYSCSLDEAHGNPVTSN